MQRFIAFIWSPANLSATEQVVRWSTKLSRSTSPWKQELGGSGLAVFALPTQQPGQNSYVLPRNRGVVLGQLFSSTGADQYTGGELVTTEKNSESIVESDGGHLVRQFWGNYVAFITNERTRIRYVIRDCSGKIPCYILRIEDIRIAFSDVGDVRSLTNFRFSIDYQYLAAFVQFDQLRIRACPIKEVTELLAGDRLKIDGEHESIDSIWHPNNFCTEERPESYEVARDHLRHAVQVSIDSWASIYSRILENLSGGLDSAIVLGCLFRSPTRPAVTCLNRYAKHTGEDERRFARAAAQKVGVDLREHEWATGEQKFGEWLFDAPEVVKPTVADLITILNIPFINQLAEELGAQSLWTGQGGDHLFMAHRTALMAADYLQHYGIGRGLLTKVQEATKLTGMSYWNAFNEAWSNRRPQQSWRPESLFNLKTLFASSDLLPNDIVQYISHPWTWDMESIPAGKRLQAFTVADLINRHLPIPRIERAEQHHPLISQPLIETCLKIPTYLLLKDGKQRGLARTVFADVVPAEIIQRESKGSSTSFIMSVLRQSRGFVRDVLLDGVLMREGVIDQKNIAPYLLSDQQVRIEDTFSWIACISAEVWARRWGSVALNVAA